MSENPFIFSKPSLEANGYIDVCKKNGAWAGINRYLFTCAVVYGFDHIGYTHRFCYKDYSAAKKALADWDGEGEPKKWHRALVFGLPERKIAPDGEVIYSSSDGIMRTAGGRIVVSY